MDCNLGNLEIRSITINSPIHAFIANASHNQMKRNKIMSFSLKCIIVDMVEMCFLHVWKVSLGSV